MEYNPLEIAYPLLRQRRYILQPGVAVARRLPWGHGTNDIEPQRGSVPSVDLTFTATPDGTTLWCKCLLFGTDPRLLIKAGWDATGSRCRVRFRDKRHEGRV